ncbi:MAG: acyl-CoA dehydrogenase family protein [Candidatus Berkiellales bacterium]
MKESNQGTNQVPPLVRKNAYEDDLPLKEALKSLNDQALLKKVAAYGEKIAALSQLGEEANTYLPNCQTHDRYGERIDIVEYHPSYHALMHEATMVGIHCLPWQKTNTQGHLARLALEYIHVQAEAGTACPLSMTYAGIPLLQKNETVAKTWLPKALTLDYDPANLPLEQKKSLTFGMAMTEKQGGSDVKANVTQALAQGNHYELIGHKWFCSAPMSDGFFVTAQANEGLSCFFVPRWHPDLSKNPMQLIRLKNKLGNQANASSEVEFHGAFGWLIGEPGKGIQTIIQMVALTRFDCIVSSTALQRGAYVYARHHANHRQAFGKKLIDQPLMRNVLAHVALEIEANLQFSVHLANILDQNDPNDRRFRLLTALGKYWICKNTSAMIGELLECLGGAGYIEDFPLARFYREAPLNAIWEGCGNIQCLDVLRTLQKEPEAFAQIVSDIKIVPNVSKAFDGLYQSLNDIDESQARRLVERLIRLYQAAILYQKAPDWLAEAFFKQQHEATQLLGTLTNTKVVDELLLRAWPE